MIYINLCIWSSGYTGMTLSETQKLSTGPTFPLFAMSSPRDETHCSAMWWDSMTTRQPTAHYHRSQQQEWPPLWSCLAATARKPARAIHGSSRSATPFSIYAEWSKARRRGHSGLTQRTSAVYAILWWWWWWWFFYINFYRAMRFKRGLCCHAVSVRLSVRPSVCPTRSWITSKRINISSKFFNHRVATPF